MTSKYSGHLLDQGHSDPRCWTTMFQKIKKNSPKFRLNVAWIGKTSNGKDFGDVTLAWEDEEQERKLMFQNCKWKWKYHDGTLAWRRRRKNGLKLNLGLLNERENISRVELQSVITVWCVTLIWRMERALLGLIWKGGLKLSSKLLKKRKIWDLSSLLSPQPSFHNCLQR